MKKKLPKFKNEDEERQFWATHDSSTYMNWRKAKRIDLPQLKQTLSSNRDQQKKHQ